MYSLICHYDAKNIRDDNFKYTLFDNDRKHYYNILKMMVQRNIIYKTRVVYIQNLSKFTKINLYAFCLLTSNQILSIQYIDEKFHLYYNV